MSRCIIVLPLYAGEAPELVREAAGRFCCFARTRAMPGPWRRG